MHNLNNEEPRLRLPKVAIPVLGAVVGPDGVIRWTRPLPVLDAHPDEDEFVPGGGFSVN